ncbi:MAG: carboxypeptidase-like regulatory domain-containing protein [Planctomycetaceae bacterium]|jgi:hypothetical protein|nr:carboxypeptidase-like regulatory domain-containing protein [Planctomycetaceae bacterium]
MKTKNIFVTICFVLLLTVFGCNNGLSPVSGTVKFSDGKSLDRGQVVLAGDKYQFYGTVQSDGTFQLNGLNGKTGLPAGSYKISFGATDDNDQSIITDTNPIPDTFEVKQGQKNVCNITVERAEEKR